ENTWVVQQFAGFGSEERNLWIGLFAAGDGGVPANYAWVSGDPSVYRNWADGEPNLNDQYTLIIGDTNAAAFGQWNNVFLETNSGYGFGPQLGDFGVAEVVPEPGVVALVLGGLGFFFLARRRQD